MSEHEHGNYDHVRCRSCGVPLVEHSDECFRHRFLSDEILKAQTLNMERMCKSDDLVKKYFGKSDDLHADSIVKNGVVS